jgi:hypothetical protein
MANVHKLRWETIRSRQEAEEASKTPASAGNRKRPFSGSQTPESSTPDADIEEKRPTRPRLMSEQSDVASDARNGESDASNEDSEGEPHSDAMSWSDEEVDNSSNNEATEPHQVLTKTADGRRYDHVRGLLSAVYC